MTTLKSTIRVWDLPTRIFHWSLVISVVAAFITVKLGGLWMDWHIRFGLATLVLIVFRFIWGLTGPRYARFGSFVRGPRAIADYVRGHTPHIVGHNPLGSLSVVAILLVFGFQAFSGLFANDDIMVEGPLAFLSSRWSGTLTGLHKLNEWIMIGLVCLHVGAVLWHRVIRREKLIEAMIHGNAQVPLQHSNVAINAQDTWFVRMAALLLAILITMGVWWLTTLAPAVSYSY